MSENHVTLLLPVLTALRRCACIGLPIVLKLMLEHRDLLILTSRKLCNGLDSRAVLL